MSKPWTLDTQPAATVCRTGRGHQGAPFRLWIDQRTSARPRRPRRGLVEPAVPSGLRRRHGDRRASRRGRHPPARPELRHGRAAPARWYPRGPPPPPAPPLFKTPDARPPPPSAIRFLPPPPPPPLR